MFIYRAHRTALKTSAAAAALLAFSAPGMAVAQTATYSFDIPAQDVSSALIAYGRTARQQLVFDGAATRGMKSSALVGEYSAQDGLYRLLEGTDLRAEFAGPGAVRIVSASAPQSGSAAGDGADGTVEALIVTAQKREEAIQDVPIAISAFTEKSLQEQKIEGGFDLLKAIPNVTFSKNNFTSYNFSIRGIGTKAVSATTDPGVAVSFNNASLIQNRLFEQEYFDVERVEVLRGPQGTLYGRNATAGVINVISAKPNPHEFSGWLKGEVGNYHAKRISAIVNVPLVEDKLAIRFAGALTDRAGYDYNATTKHAVNGRDLWSGRITVGFNPTERIRTNLIWERFDEDDNRSRTGKQLCKRDDGPDKIGDTPIGVGPKTKALWTGVAYSQGCLPVSLYDDQAFQTPNGLALPFVSTILELGADFGDEFGGYSAFLPVGFAVPIGEGYQPRTILLQADPYGGLLQTKDLRVINSFRDPIYRAKADVIQLNLDIDITPSLVLSSQTTYDKDKVYSFQDYNRFNTLPIFQDVSSLYTPYPFDPATGEFNANRPTPWKDLTKGGIYCDPQVGCSNTLAGFDISKAESAQFIQELRLQSSFDGPLNLSVGINYTRFKVLADYYVLFNLITAFAQIGPFNNQGDLTKCGIGEHDIFGGTLSPPLPSGDPATGCPYIDPNPLESMNGEGHNYFRSKNPYKLSSAAAFGEIYWAARPNLNVTAGLRYTDDRKTFTPVPSQLLFGKALFTGGFVNRGYPADPDIKQHWGEVTGRLGVDWKPELALTDSTMVYAFYSRGYKGGGANPPRIGYTTETIAEKLGQEPGSYPPFDVPYLRPIAQNATPTFKPEFVNAFELGAKNRLAGGAIVLNASTFYYDYKDYQISKVVDRTVANENFDARVWGVELESVIAPSRNLRVIANLGYLHTQIGKGAKSIDIMNRTQSNPDWILIKPWVQFPSNCIVPLSIAEAFLENYRPDGSNVLCGGGGLSQLFGVTPPIDPLTGETYSPVARYPDGSLVYPDINGGAGFVQNLEGNELPNSPHWTANIGAQYSVDFASNWKATIRGDAYWQSQSWARVYNAVNDKLHGWYNANLSLWLENDDGLKIELYAKNLLDKTPITDAFINSDDTALTTNVFVLDPRLIGLSIKKDF